MSCGYLYIDSIAYIHITFNGLDFLISSLKMIYYYLLLLRLKSFLLNVMLSVFVAVTVIAFT